MTKYIFFSGKGGVGKTTMACATAIHYALEGQKTLIVTTDPASNLADVFEQEIGHKITPIFVGALHELPLHAMEIDPDEATREYKERIIGPFREIMPEDVIASLEENLSGPCTTEMASFDRFIDFMEGDEYEVIVFDTAPTGHTIRLLELPVDWSKHIEESAKGSGQTCLGPVQSIQESKDKYDRATSLLKDPERTDFIFVMRPEELSLYETLRASKELETIGIKSGEIIINGILPEEVCEIEFFRKKYEAQQKVIWDTELEISKPKRYMLLRDNEVKGLGALKDVAGELFAMKREVKNLRKCEDKESFTSQHLNLSASQLHNSTSAAEQLFIPENGSKAIFFTGKGGVGKTTISCVAALYAARKGFKTLLVTTDPAAHIGEVFDVSIGSLPEQITENLYAVMVDQEEAIIEYKEKILDDARDKYSEDMIAAMEEELNSPCMVEMAAFDKFIQFIEGKNYDVVVFDTAPTGHTLRLLDLPFDYAKQVEMMVSTAESVEAKETAQNRFKEIVNILRDKNRTVFSLVLYPESTPIMESYRAMLDLRNAGIETQLVVANMVLSEEVCVNAFFKNRRGMQMKYLKEIMEKFDLPVLQFPLMQEEIKGVDALNTASDILYTG
ncbi:MAG: TRC40/GET3/ArsA family transport-energizing ATPase [Nitrospirae bacterium]|nr:TRC40/GET3/ArsA family transport-energizing ATPase [Nitrospirota bacterium]